MVAHTYINTYKEISKIKQKKKISEAYNMRFGILPFSHHSYKSKESKQIAERSAG